ncbi:MAG: hypothetical protein P5681_06965 [Limnospira sp. PMC 894.15]|uniref:Uncharacterized protein n=2 Tax=Limnospira TaxID=2596745 RepID=A0A9P1KFI9_9CYAN|nr:hypothetical protein [Limnospira sp. PMC 894.15]CDM95836.1 conserved hypothetical protein [Limnospira indica PCC 8005]
MEIIGSFSMARYTAFFVIAINIQDAREILIDIMESCNLDLIYQTPSSLIAREAIGQVSISQLVTLEVVFDTATSTDTEIKMTVVLKNEELPLQPDNHCRQMFELVSEMIINHRQWVLLESMTL